MSRRQGGEVVAAMRHVDTDDGRSSNANSQLQEVDAVDGSLVGQYVSSCAGSPLGYNALSHECRADRATFRRITTSGDDDDMRVLTTRYAARRIPNVTVAFRNGTRSFDRKADVFLGTQVVAWDRSTNDVEVLYDLFDLAKPSEGGRTFASSNWNDVRAGCSGNTTTTGVEYHHVSSVTVGTQANVLVASRSLNTIWSLRHDGGGALWTLSSSLERNTETAGDWYAFERDVDRFYDPHTALQLPNGDVLVVDDGDDRPGCTVDRRGQCFSRVVCYALDSETMVASVRWQFEWPYALSDLAAPPERRRRLGRGGDAAAAPSDMAAVSERDAYSSVGGSVAPLSNGNYLVAFTSVDARATYDGRGAALAFEVDVEGGASAVSTLAVPTPLADQDKQGAYRLVPWDSIAKETNACPFDAS